MKHKLLLLLPLIIIIASCSTKIDSTTEESYKNSIEEIKKGLDDQEKEKFQEAITKIAFGGFESLADFSKMDVEKVRAKFHGLTYNDVINEGERIQKEIDEKNREQARIEIGELYQIIENSKKDSLNLSKFEIVKSRFYKKKSYFMEEPVIDLTVLNGTKKPISRAYFKGILKSPERSIPWLVEEFNYEISGGIEPNEKANWKLDPGYSGSWRNVDVPKDAIFTVIVSRLDGVGGEKLYSNDFGDKEKERLQELIKDYPEFQQ